MLSSTRVNESQFKTDYFTNKEVKAFHMYAYVCLLYLPTDTEDYLIKQFSLHYIEKKI